MKSTLVLLLRELRERWLVLPLCVLCGLVPAGVELVSSPEDRHALSSAVLLGVMGGLALLLAFLTGPSLLGRDLYEKRLGFYFVRPLSPWNIWAGKVMGGIVLLLLSQLCVLLPWLLIYRHLPEVLATTPHLISMTLVLPLFLLAIGIVVGLFSREQARGRVLDLMLLPLLLLGCYLCIGELSHAASLGALPWGLRQPEESSVLLLAALLPVLLLASCVAVVRGRTDAPRVHRYLSLTLWSLSFWPVLLMGLYARATLRVTPSDLLDLPTQGGAWVFLSRPVRGRPEYQPRFLYHPATGGYYQIRIGERLYPFSTDQAAPDLMTPDHEYAVWFDERQMYMFHLTDPAARPVSVPGRYWGAAAMSPDRTRLVCRDYVSGDVVVIAIPSGKPVMRMALPKYRNHSVSAQFESPDRVRLRIIDQSYGNGILHPRTVDLDLRTGTSKDIEDGAKKKVEGGAGPSHEQGGVK